MTKPTWTKQLISTFSLPRTKPLFIRYIGRRTRDVKYHLCKSKKKKNIYKHVVLLRSSFKMHNICQHIIMLHLLQGILLIILKSSALVDLVNMTKSTGHWRYCVGLNIRFQRLPIFEKMTKCPTYDEKHKMIVYHAYLRCTYWLVYAS